MSPSAHHLAAVPSAPSDVPGPPGSRGAIVISSGRCGSTVLSDVLAQHADVLPLVEFFGPQHRAGTAQQPISGSDFWALVNEPRRSLSLLLRLGRPPSTLRYDLARLGGRTELSGLLGFTLPAISDDPDGLLDAIREDVLGFETRPLGQQYLALFHLLTVRCGRSTWIEKSATSAFYARDLVQMFPDAPVIYLTRDLVDVALSMSHHPMFQLADITVEFIRRCGFDPFFNRSEGAAAEGDVPDELRHLLPDRLTAEALDARAGSTAALQRMAAMQGIVARHTEDLLATLPPWRVLRVSYENLLSDTEHHLLRLGAFLGLDDFGPWAARAAGTVSRQPSRRDQIDAATVAQLEGIFHERYEASAA